MSIKPPKEGVAFICRFTSILNAMKTVSSRRFLALIAIVVVTFSPSPIPSKAAGEYKLVRIDPSKHIPQYYALDIPWFGQETSISCGPACLKMLFAKHGWTVNEEEIQQAANMKPSHGGTWTGDMIRAAHFSNMSTALDNASLQGYTSKPFGSDSVGTRVNEQNRMDLLKKLLIQEKTPILLMWYTVAQSYGHYRILRAYDDRSETLYFADPMGYNATLGVNWTLPYDELVSNWWSYSGYWLQIVSDWKIKLEVNEAVSESSRYHVYATISTGIDEEFRETQSILQNCSATVRFPDGWELNSGTKTAPIEFNQTGVASAQWDIVCQNHSAHNTITVTARGFVEGQTRSYDSYRDMICASESADISQSINPSLERFNVSHRGDSLGVEANVSNSQDLESCQLLWRNGPTNWEKTEMERTDSGIFSTTGKIPEPGMEENKSLQMRLNLTKQNNDSIQTSVYEYRFYETTPPISPISISSIIVGGIAIITIIAVVVIISKLRILKPKKHTSLEENPSISRKERDFFD